MNKRQAKKIAAHHAYMLIEGQLQNGWETLTDYYSPPDVEKVEAGLNELAQEMFNRSRTVRAFDKGDE